MSTNAIFSRRRPDPSPPPESQEPAPALRGEAVKNKFADCADFELREVQTGAGEAAAVCWLDGLVSGKDVSEDVLRPLTDPARWAGEAPGAPAAWLLHGAVWACAAKERRSVAETAADLLRGCCAVIFDADGTAVTFEVKSGETRSVSEPKVEKTVKGAKDAFVETLRVNTALVRRRLRTPECKLLQTRVGRRSATDVAILYIDGICNPDTLSELRRRLDAIDVDGLTAAGGIEQYLTDRPGALFPQLLHTERPDRFAEELLAGRIGLLADGLPVGFLLPANLPAFLRVAEDRAQHWAVASLLTLLRWLSLGLSLLLPAFFTAIAMYHQEMIPTRLLLSMIQAKQEVPFSVAVEVLTLLAAFELLMEAGIRLPDPVGDTVSIIGGLIVGQSAVEARVVSPIAVIVVAVTAICGFTQPSRDLGAALRLARLGLVLLAIALGLFGIMLGTAMLVWYLCSLESFGVPYTAPMAEGGFREVLKAMIRLPLPADKRREPFLRPRDQRRQK